MISYSLDVYAQKTGKTASYAISKDAYDFVKNV